LIRNRNSRETDRRPLPLLLRRLGRVPYAEAQAIQSTLVEERRSGAEHDTLLLLEHPPVITLGRGSDRNHLLVDELELARRGIELHHCGRGGDVTFHGPGQLVGYPILALRGERRDAHRYLRDLEEALIHAVGDLGVAATREPGLTGIWAGGEKLAAIGVRLSTGWITSHGFAINVSTNLEGFSSIVPCGIRDRGVTSMARLLGRPLDMHHVETRVAARLAEVFERRIVASPEAA
jgi:lipoate-protein ligase B